MSDLTKESLQLLLDTGRAQAGVLSFTSPDGKPSEPFVILPNNAVQSVAHLGAPTRVKQTVALIDAVSFCAYVNRFKTPDSQIFATVSPAGAKLTAILDYHGAPARPPVTDTVDTVADRLYSEYCERVGGKAFNGDPLPDWAEFSTDSSKTKQADAWRVVARLSGASDLTPLVVTPEVPRYTNHRANLELIQTPDWVAWQAADRKPKNQVEFATWLEEFNHLFNHKDCVLKGAELLELINTLFAKQDVSYTGAVRLQTTGFSCNYQENTNVTGTMKEGVVALPPIIQAGLQPFEGGPVYLVSARLKVKLENRKLLLWFETVQKEKFVRDSILDAVKVVAEQTGIVPLIGTAN